MNIFYRSLIVLVSMIIFFLIVSCATHLEQSSELNRPVPVAQESEEDKIVITGSRISGGQALIRERRGRQNPRDSANILSRAEAQKNKIDQKRSWKPSTQSANNAVIKVGSGEEIKAEAIDVKVQIDGFRARVLIDGYYTNPHGRQLEGSFRFRLPNDARPYFFAFGESLKFNTDEISTPVKIPNIQNRANQNRDIRLSPTEIMRDRQLSWKQPKQAIMVKREAAAFAYHNTVAQQIDPALMEWSGAGVFNAKVFPLMPHKTHRIVIGYDIDLSTSNTGLNLDLPLPQSRIEKRVHLLIDQQPDANVFVQKLIKKKLRSAQQIEKFEGISQISYQGKNLDGLKITIANPQKPTIFGEDEVGRYFAHQFEVKLPAIGSQTQEHIIFALDTSLSSAPDKFHRWTKLIKAILSNNESTIKRFNLMSFGIQQKWWESYFVENTATNREKLNAYLNKLVLEGATDLFSAIKNVSNPYWHTSSHSFDLFLMSDGRATWGEESPHLIGAQINQELVSRLFTYRLNQGVEDSGMLTQLAKAARGVNYVIDSDVGIEGLSIAHNRQAWMIEGLLLDQGDDLLIRGKPSSLYSGQLLTIAGRLKSSILDGARVKLVMSNGRKRVEQVIEIANLIESKLASRTYGQIAVEQLESIDPLLKQHASSYANHYRVPGKSSSLLMLETAEDYKRYQIAPVKDKETILATRVGQLFANLAEEQFEQLLSYKSKFVDLFDSLTKMKQIRFTPRSELTQLVEVLPESSFRLSERSDDLSQKHNQSRIKINKRGKYAKAIKKGSVKYRLVIDEANKRLERGNNLNALQAISSLVEQAPKDVAALREVAFNAQSWQLQQQAYDLHFKVAKLRPYEPQSYSFLAKLAQESGNNELALLFYELGLASDWQGRFGDFEFIHTIDYLNFLKQLKQSKDMNNSIRKFGLARLEQLDKTLEIDSSKLIVAIAWNTDRTDVDLHVIEPTGEECYYQHQKTQSGGFITSDVTTGYGPEMYVNPKGPKGIYKFYVNYYSSDRNKLGLDTKVYVRTIKHWGTERQEEKSYTVSLKKAKDKAKVGQLRL